MKKLCSLMLAFMAASFSFTANADPVTFKLNVVGYEHFSSLSSYLLTFVNSEQTKFQEGVQEISADPSQYPALYVTPASGYGAEVVRWYHYNVNDKDTLVAQNMYVGTSYSSVYLSGVQAGDSVVLKAWEIAAERTASCTVYVDDATKASFGYSSGTINLPSGKDTVIYYAPKADRLSDIPFMVRGNGVTIYEVTLDGVVQKDYYGNKSCYSYSITPVAGQPNKIVITTAFPDVQVAFNFTDEAGMVDSVYVNGVKDNDFREASHTIPLGATVKLFFNTENFKLNSLTVDGSQPYVSGNYYEWQVVSESGTTVVVDATKYVEAAITINVDVASNVKVWKSSQSGSLYSYDYSEEIALEDGENEVKIVLGKTPYLYVENANKSTILTFVDGENNSYMGYLGSDPSNYGYAKSITLVDGMKLALTTKTFVRDKKCYMTVNAASNFTNGATVQYTGESSNLFDIAAAGTDVARTEVPFDASETFNFQFRGTRSSVYINNVRYVYSDYLSNLALNDGDEVIIYGGSADAVGVDTVILSPSTELSSSEEFVRNTFKITEVGAYWSDILNYGIHVLPGGATLHMHVGAGVKVTVIDSEENSTTITVDENGDCEIEVDKNLTISLEEGSATAMQETSATVKATKVVRDGRVLIIRGEEAFDVLGNVVVR